MNKEEFEKYVKSPQWKIDLDEAAKLIRSGDNDAIAEFVGRGNKELAQEAAYMVQHNLDLKTIPKEDCIKRRLYVIHSRNLANGVFDGDRGFLGLREKLGSVYVFTEYYADGGAYGTVLPVIDTGIDLPEDIFLRERLEGSFCFDCKGKATWTGSREPSGKIIPGPWICENNCVKVSPFSYSNEKLFDFLKEHEKAR